MESVLYVFGGVVLGFFGCLLLRVLKPDGGYRYRDTLVIKQKDPGGKIIMQPKTVRLFEGGQLKYRNELNDDVQVKFSTSRDGQLGPFAEKAGEARGDFGIPAGTDDDRQVDVTGGRFFPSNWDFVATVNGQKVDPRVKVKKG